MDSSPLSKWEWGPNDRRHSSSERTNFGVLLLWKLTNDWHNKHRPLANHPKKNVGIKAPRTTYELKSDILTSPTCFLVSSTCSCRLCGRCSLICSSTCSLTCAVISFRTRSVSLLFILHCTYVVITVDERSFYALGMCVHGRLHLDVDMDAITSRSISPSNLDFMSWRTMLMSASCSSIFWPKAWISVLEDS